MKTHLASIRFLVLIPGIVFWSGLLEAASIGSSKPTATVAAESSGTNRTGTATSGTNRLANDKQWRAIQKLRDRRDALSAQLNDLLTKYPEKDRRVRATREQIADVEKELAKKSKVALSAEISKANRSAAEASNTTAKSTDAKAKATNAPANVRLVVPQGGTATSGTNTSANDKQSRAIQKLRDRRDALSAQLNELLTKYPEKDRRVRATRKEIADVEKELAKKSNAAATTSKTNRSAEASNTTAKSTDAKAKATNAPANVRLIVPQGGTATSGGSKAAAGGTNAAANVPLLTSAATSAGGNAPAKGTSVLATASDAIAKAKSTKAADGKGKDTNVTGKATGVSADTTNTPDNVRLLIPQGGTATNDSSYAKANTTSPSAKAESTNAPADVRLVIPEGGTGKSDTNATAGTNMSVNLVSMETLDDKHRLAIGDKLSFRIEEDKHRLPPPVEKTGARSDEDPTPLLVTDSGELEVPYIGRFPAENKTCKHLAYELKAALEKDYFYKATVIVAVDLKTKSRGRVYLNGAVHFPGPQEIPSDEILTLGKVILRAGGFTDFAERHNVKVTRQTDTGPSKNKTLVVDVAQVFDHGKTERDLPLESGDLILVSERLIRF
jgi:protein involved in polysaccharide export with SLBB domain/uncharacterized coiled-coil DUF342 family protein